MTILSDIDSFELFATLNLFLGFCHQLPSIVYIFTQIDASLHMPIQNELINIRMSFPSENNDKNQNQNCHNFIIQTTPRRGPRPLYPKHLSLYLKSIIPEIFHSLGDNCLCPFSIPLRNMCSNSLNLMHLFMCDWCPNTASGIKDARESWQHTVTHEIIF